MNLKKYFTIVLLKKVGLLVLQDAVIPMAKEYVEETDNPYDDAFVQFLEKFAAEKVLAIKAA